MTQSDKAIIKASMSVLVARSINRTFRIENLKPLKICLACLLINNMTEYQQEAAKRKLRRENIMRLNL